jgi:UDP-glucose 4-epimerase
MIVLVTGANGLVGRSIVDRLSVEENVTLIAQYQNIPLSDWDASVVNSIQVGLGNKEADNVLDAIAPDLIVHCAAKIPTTKLSPKDAAEFNKAIDSTIYHFADRRNIPVIFISSVIVYEASRGISIESDFLQPFSPYAKQKLESELLFSMLNQPCSSLRISSPYGGFQNPDRNVLYKFIHTALNNDVLHVYGTGDRNQNFISASDIAEAVWTLALAKLSGRSFEGVFNIASGSSISMKNLAELVINIVGQGTVVCTGETDFQESVNFPIDIQKAWQTFGWKPTTSLPSGVESIISLLRKLKCE